VVARSRPQFESYVDGHLQLVASDEAAWTDDYVCPQTGARWRRSWPHSELHGGGPSRLDRLAGRAAEGQVAVISLAIHDRDERPLFAYRTEPEKPHDSGWTLTAGESHEEIRQARLAWRTSIISSRGFPSWPTSSPMTEWTRRGSGMPTLGATGTYRFQIDPDNQRHQRAQSPISCLNAGSWRMASRSVSRFASSRNSSESSIARRRWSSASADLPVRLSQQARL
jgi:hypothetical protein